MAHEKTALKSIFKKILLILAPFFALALLELFFLPEDLFTFRAWEALLIKGRNVALSGAFYPNRIIHRLEQGDLGAYTKNSMEREVIWQTDQDGFRNSPGKCQSYPVVLVGDSFVVGTGLSQNETLAEALSRRMGKCVYSFATMEINDFLASERWKTDKPSTVIYVKSEWWLKNEHELPGQARKLSGSKIVEVFGENFLANSFVKKLIVVRDRFGKSLMLGAFRSHGPFFVLGRIFEYFARGNHFEIHNDFSKSAGIKEMLFRTKHPELEEPDREIRQDIVERLSQYDQFFLKEKVRFLVMPIPNKETIYLKDLPRRGEYLQDIMAQASDRKIEVVNILDSFLREASLGGNAIYQTDDTHWSRQGVEMASEELANHLK